MEWREKHKRIECPHCRGTGEVGGGFKDLDGARPCPECHGTRVKLVAPKTTPPDIPTELRDHMRRAWSSFNSKKPWWAAMWELGSGPNPFHTCKLCGKDFPGVESVLVEHSESHLRRKDE